MFSGIIKTIEIIGAIAATRFSEVTPNGVLDLPSGHCRTSLTIVPHAWALTNLDRHAVGGLMSVETDILAIQVERRCKPSH